PDWVRFRCLDPSCASSRSSQPLLRNSTGAFSPMCRSLSSHKEAWMDGCSTARVVSGGTSVITRDETKWDTIRMEISITMLLWSSSLCTENKKCPDSPRNKHVLDDKH
ncbi:hypothetical protein PENTCL1PPCAC_29998, partial [Pristionchus entomophagus]